MRFSTTLCLCMPQVCVDNVLKTMKENANKASSILLTAIPQISQMDWAPTIKTLKVSLQSHPSEEVVKADVYTFAILRRDDVSYFYIPHISLLHIYETFMRTIKPFTALG